MITVFADAISAEHQLLNKLNARTDAGVVEDDRIIDRGAFADVAAGPDHRGTNQCGSVFDLGHATHIDRTLNINSVPVGCHIQAGVDPWTNLLAWDSHLANIALKHASDRAPVVGNLADVDPFKLHRQGIERCADLN